MIITNKTYKCDCCGLVFQSENGYNGSDVHDSYSGVCAMELIVKSFQTVDNSDKYDLFLDSITLTSGFIENHTYEVGIQIFNCRIKWLLKNGYTSIANYLESNRGNIRTEFNNVALKLIAKKKKEIKQLEERIIVVR